MPILRTCTDLRRMCTERIRACKVVMGRRTSVRRVCSGTRRVCSVTRRARRVVLRVARTEMSCAWSDVDCAASEVDRARTESDRAWSAVRCAQSDCAFAATRCACDGALCKSPCASCTLACTAVALAGSPCTLAGAQCTSTCSPVTLAESPIDVDGAHCRFALDVCKRKRRLCTSDGGRCTSVRCAFLAADWFCAVAGSVCSCDGRLCQRLPAAARVQSRGAKAPDALVQSHTSWWRLQADGAGMQRRSVHLRTQWASVHEGRASLLEEGASSHCGRSVARSAWSVSYGPWSTSQASSSRWPKEPSSSRAGWWSSHGGSAEEAHDGCSAQGASATALKAL
jgi:hypothetical protein